MKKVIAIFFTLIYLPFVTAALWPEGDGENSLMRQLQGAHQHGIAAFDEASQKEATLHVALSKSLNHAAKQVTATGKRKTPRTGAAGLVFQSTISKTATAHRCADVSSTTPTLYHGPLFLKNGVLRI